MQEEEEEGTDGERGERWAREEGETGGRSLRGQRKEVNGVTQVERRKFIMPLFQQHGTYSSICTSLPGTLVPPCCRGDSKYDIKRVQKSSLEHT